jgi:very-short-patch-repair endonuclease
MTGYAKRGILRSEFFLPYNPDLVERAREMRKNPTTAEKKLWYGYLWSFKRRVLTQRPIDNFSVDFYCAELKLPIEIDGETHFTEESKAYDEARTKALEGYGLRVMRFNNRDVLDNFAAVSQAIEEILPSSLKKEGKEQ